METCRLAQAEPQLRQVARRGQEIPGKTFRGDRRESQEVAVDGAERLHVLDVPAQPGAEPGEQRSQELRACRDPVRGGADLWAGEAGGETCLGPSIAGPVRVQVQAVREPDDTACEGPVGELR